MRERPTEEPGREARITRAGALLACACVLLSLAIRSLYAVDLASSMYVKGQPAMRMAARYDEAALRILEGGGILFPSHPDPEDTGILARPPGYAFLLSLLYRALGRSFFAVELVQNVVNSLGTLLVVFLAWRLAGGRAGILAGLLMALSPHLAFCSNLLLPDALCPVALLLGASILARPEPKALSYVLSGAILGGAAWLRPNMVLVAPCLALCLLVSLRKRPGKELLLLPLFAGLAVLPITLRNYLVFHEFVPMSINGGLTLWEGIAEAGGQKYGAHRGDKQVMEEEAARYKNPRYAEWWAAPDGIRRDRDRMRRSWAVISAHPLWYGRAMLRRMGRMLDYWSTPPPLVAASEDEVSAPPQEEDPSEPNTNFDERAAGKYAPKISDDACLLPGRAAAFLRRPARLLQWLSRVLTLPLVILGTLALAARNFRHALFLWTVPLYCLLTESWMLLEWRVVASMHVFLFVCAGALLSDRRG